jgi:hypothetical protein
MTGIIIKSTTAALIVFGAMTAIGRADDVDAQMGLRPGECIRSGYMSTTCAPDTPRYFNRVERGQTKGPQRVHERD